LDYAAPEQMGKLPGVSVGPTSDIYGFGKTCCFALFKTTQPLLKHWKSLPSEVAEMLEQCLDEEPKNRPQNFNAVLDQLLVADKGSPVILEALVADEIPVAEAVPLAWDLEREQRGRRTNDEEEGGPSLGNSRRRGRNDDCDSQTEEPKAKIWKDEPEFRERRQADTTSGKQLKSAHVSIVKRLICGLIFGVLIPICVIPILIAVEPHLFRGRGGAFLGCFMVTLVLVGGCLGLTSFSKWRWSRVGIVFGGFFVVLIVSSPFAYSPRRVLKSYTDKSPEQQEKSPFDSDVK
jgi:serine/threonine protein kinase